MKSQHTPGPWKSEAEENNEYYDIVAEDGQIVTTVQHGDNILQIEDNARLIAAAPDMLAVLQEAVEHKHVYDTNPALVELFQAIITKATQP